MSTVDQVIDALRFGWAVAEAYGRSRPGWSSRLEVEQEQSSPTPIGHVLPLRTDRSAAAQRREAEKVMARLAERFGIDRAPPATIEHAAWAERSAAFAAFDVDVQDALATVDDVLACAYLLGRGLAESYWGLDEAPTAEAWAHVFSPERCGELGRLVGRLGPHLNRYTPPAVAGSLKVWQAVAHTPAWRGTGDGARECLYLQLRRWYELLVLGQDPTTLVKPLAVIKGRRQLLRTVKLFLPQAVSATTFTTLAAVGLAGVNGKGGASAAMLGVATAGMSATAVQGRLKNSSQALLTRLRQDLYVDLVAVAISVVPPTRHTEKAVAAALRDRELTTAVAVT